MNVRIPPIKDIKNAIIIYYTKPEIDNKDISELFGANFSMGKLSRMRALVRQQMKEEQTPFFNANAVNTDVAYRVWGFPIEDLEARYNKLKKLKLID